MNARYGRRCTVLALLAVTWCGVVATDGHAERPPTPAETRLIAEKIGHPVGLSSIRISTVDPSFISLHWFANSPGGYNEIYHFSRTNGFEQVYSYRRNQPADGACAFAPAKVVKDLLGASCPPWRALHARPATPTEQLAIIAGFRNSPLTRKEPSGARLVHVCISRLDPHWASGLVALSNGGGIAWLHEAPTGWVSVYETVFISGRRPPHELVLSLASCTGYSAAEYGG